MKERRAVLALAAAAPTAFASAVAAAACATASAAAAAARDALCAADCSDPRMLVESCGCNVRTIIACTDHARISSSLSSS